MKGGGNFEYGKEKLEHEIRYHKFAISNEGTGLRLTFSFNSIAQFLYKENANKKKIKIYKNWTKPKQFFTAPSEQ